MASTPVGIIGGTGLGDALREQTQGEAVKLETPFGLPSSEPILANWEGVDIVFLARHGLGHQLNPTSVPYRANIWAMKKLGVQAIIASGATGSLREDIEPGHLVLCDQVIDKTVKRINTFFDEDVVAHVDFADPFCADLRSRLGSVGEHVDTVVHHEGTYVCMEGPQFSTRAESIMHRQWGGDLIGMTCMPEAKLAREAQMCYSLVALPTDYDCWRPVDPQRDQDDLLTEIIGNLKRATDNAIGLILAALRAWPAQRPICKCQQALSRAIWTKPADISETAKQRLGLLIDPHLK